MVITPSTITAGDLLRNPEYLSRYKVKYHLIDGHIDTWYTISFAKAHYNRVILYPRIGQMSFKVSPNTVLHLE
jgi:hypothetical protein